jgi:hypothetical protein
MKYALPVILTLLGGILPSARADWKDDIGYTSLVARLGGSTPTGAGIGAAHVEGLFNGNYRPDEASSEFTGIVWNNIACSGCSTGVSFHANKVGSYYYGRTLSIAPGINSVNVNEVNNWVNFTLMYNQASNPTESQRVQNHSWIGTSIGGADEINRRLDMLIQNTGVVVAAGVNNVEASTMPYLLSPSYNAIAVGVTTGRSSYGPVVAGIDGAGRVKPDLVVPSLVPPDDLTSWGVPMAASSSALLLQEEDKPAVAGSLSQPARSLLAKCLLMEGCTRQEFTCSTKGAGGPWRKGFATPTTDGSVPLDYRYGAGELNIDNSHRILTTNTQQVQSSSVTRLVPGWNYTTINNGNTHQYFFDVPASNLQREFSVLVTWNRKVTRGGAMGTTLTPTLANINLKLYNATGFTRGSQIDQSISTIDNVEFIVVKPIATGRYVFEVTTDTNWEYAVAWDLRSALPPDLNMDGDVDTDDVALFKGCATHSGVVQNVANCKAADFDGDGDVDMNDFAKLQRCYSGSCVLAKVNCFP